MAIDLNPGPSVRAIIPPVCRVASFARPIIVSLRAPIGKFTRGSSVKKMALCIKYVGVLYLVIGPSSIATLSLKM